MTETRVNEATGDTNDCGSGKVLLADETPAAAAMAAPLGPTPPPVPRATSFGRLRTRAPGEHISPPSAEPAGRTTTAEPSLPEEGANLTSSRASLKSPLASASKPLREVSEEERAAA
eukprot:5573790-Prymnesium_polylepis.1